MLVGVALGKRYKWYKWLFVSLIVVGISLFMFKDVRGSRWRNAT